jgi:hypothetical protein
MQFDKSSNQENHSNSRFGHTMLPSYLGTVATVVVLGLMRGSCPFSGVNLSPQAWTCSGDFLTRRTLLLATGVCQGLPVGVSPAIEESASRKVSCGARSSPTKLTDAQSRFCKSSTPAVPFTLLHHPNFFASYFLASIDSCRIALELDQSLTCWQMSCSLDSPFPSIRKAVRHGCPRTQHCQWG